MIPIHGNALHGGACVVGCAQYDRNPFVFSNHRSRLAQFGEQIPGIAQLLKDGFVKFPGLGIDHAHGGGVGEFLRLGAAELVHQIFGNHQKIRDPFQPPCFLIGIELIDGIEGLELAAGMAVQLGEGHFFMHLGNDRLGAAVPVGVHRPDFFLALQQHIVHAPGIDGQGGNVGKRLLCLRHARFHIVQQGIDVPDQVSVLFGDTVWETVYLFCPYRAVFQPAHNMPAGGRADIDG